MHRNPSAPTYLILAGLTLVLAGCGGSDNPAMTIGFSNQAILQSTDRIAIYFFTTPSTCNEARSLQPRPPSAAGPFILRLDAEGREVGVTFTRSDIPAGAYVVLADALDPEGMVVGTGCAQMQRVTNRELSKIRIDIGSQGASG
jgi:hypothetical protein